MSLINLLKSLAPGLVLLISTAVVAIYILVNFSKDGKQLIEFRVAEKDVKSQNVPISVNYHFTRKCNYTCGFCFHTDTSSYVLPVSEVQRGLGLLSEAGMRKLNIAGGEPFLYPQLLTQILRYCKEDLHLESVSIVSNGSKIREKWLRENSQWLDILAISCDSFHADVNKKIGRGDDGKNVDRLFRIAQWCKEYGIKFKLNTVVNTHNWDEDMVVSIERLAPFRWKVFQCLLVAGENDEETRKRDARTFLVTEEQWRTFYDLHKQLKCFVPEDNAAMASSYLLLDEYMCFLDKGEGMVTKSKSILDVGVAKAMKEVVWDKETFVERGGVYDWSKADVQKAGCGGRKEGLDW